MGGLYTKTITRTHNRTLPGRNNGFSIGADYSTTYTFDTKGRLDSVSGPGLPSNGVAYDRVANSELLWKTKYMTGPSTVAAYSGRQYETTRDVLDWVDNRWNTTPVSTYNYATDETYTHDDDGNLTGETRPSAGWATYTWDAENRLLSVDPRTLSAGKKKMEFRYDHLGRRVEKKVSSWNGSVGTVDSLQRFVYDGWNVVLVLNGLSGNAVARKYTWGLDLSGTLQGAGGIGGLLGFWDSNTYGYWYFYDGNGNVVQVMGSSSLHVTLSSRALTAIRISPGTVIID